MNKLGKIVLTLLGSLVICPLFASEGPVEVEVTNSEIRKTGNKVEVSFDIQTSEVPSNYKITFIPILYNETSEFVTLAPMSIVGRHMDKLERRAGRVSGDRRVVRRKDTRTLKYSATVPFQEWMQFVSVAIHPFAEGCTNRWEEETAVIIAEDKLLYLNLIPYFDDTKLEYELTELEKYDLENPFLHPMEDYGKRYDILVKDRDKGSSTVNFKVGSSVIDTDMQDNRSVLEAILRAFELIEQDPNAILKHIFIAGYASPEGSLAFNTRLAKDRAEAVKRYIQSHMAGSNENLFELYNGREDWDGLREKVENSTMIEKHDIMHTIDSYTMEQEQRKGELRRLAAGAPYKYMLENFYPPLRSAGYVQVYYEIDRRASVATAVTDAHGRTTWIDPDSPQNRGVTAINRSVELMTGFRFPEALELLLEFADDPRAWNNIGVCYMMQNDFDRAEDFLTRAVAHGDRDAPRNLEQIGWARKIKQ